MIKRILISATLLASVSVATAATADDRFWHDPNGNVFHEDSTGAYAQVFAASGGAGAASTIATAVANRPPASSGFSGTPPILISFVDAQQPPHVWQGTYEPGTAQLDVVDRGASPDPTCPWVGTPAISTYVYYSAVPFKIPTTRVDTFVEGDCGGKRHLYHRVTTTSTCLTASGCTDSGWIDVTPLSVVVGSQVTNVVLSTSPATPSNRNGDALDVVLFDASGDVVHGTLALPSATAVGNFSWSAAGPSAPPSDQDGAWASDPAVIFYETTSAQGGVIYATNHLRVFAVTAAGRIDYRDWTAKGGWGDSTTWVAPFPACSIAAPGAAVDWATGTEMVGCVVEDTTPPILRKPDHIFHAGYGTNTLGSAWYQLAAGAYGAALVMTQ